MKEVKWLDYVFVWEEEDVDHRGNVFQARWTAYSMSGKSDWCDNPTRVRELSENTVERLREKLIERQRRRVQSEQQRLTQMEAAEFPTAKSA
jgi:hypothetical protein